jgi:hypothetical protein
MHTLTTLLCKLCNSQHHELLVAAVPCSTLTYYTLYIQYDKNVITDIVPSAPRTVQALMV